ncbi:MAG: SDR family NAD(P)-dependent oxidoreductase, partial [Rhizomicrobium sp.]|jgi:NAD(P)-dependent dehydrogenase (short-subunit alcohol dehydrogenase family)
MISPPGMEPYSATKFAVVAMSEGWSQQLAPLDIGVSVLCPGFVRTRIHESGRARQDRYGGHGEVDPGVGATRDEAAQNVMHGLDADIVGARVLEAVKANELYIFTHPEMKEYAEARFKNILAAFDSAAHSDALKAKPQAKR